MSTSYHVMGVVPNDEKYEKMKQVYEACERAEIDIPEDVEDYFEGEPPNEKGMVISLKEYVKTTNESCYSCYDVNLSELPENVKYISFRVSY